MLCFCAWWRNRKRRCKERIFATAYFSREQREIIRCILDDGAELLVEEDETLLTNLWRGLEPLETENDSSWCFSNRKSTTVYRRGAAVAFLVIAVAVISIPFSILVRSAILAAVGIPSVFFVVSNGGNGCERESLSILIAELRSFMHTVHKALQWINETSRCDDFLYESRSNGGNRSGEAIVELNSCLTRSMLELVHGISESSRALISKSRRLSDICIEKDCFARHKYELEETLVGHISPDGLRRLRIDLQAHCSEYLKLAALAHTFAFATESKMCEQLQLRATHEFLQNQVSECLQQLQASYYSAVYICNAEEDAHERAERRVRQLGESQALVEQHVHETSRFTLNALLECTQLRADVDCNVLLDADNVRRTLGRMAITLECALRSVKVALCNEDLCLSATHFTNADRTRTRI